MGYTRIVQYGNIIETYEYEKNRIRKPTQSHLRIHRLLHKETCHTSKIKETKQGNKATSPANSNGTFRKSSAVNRTLRDFFRLVHHNVTYAQTIHFITLTFIYDIKLQDAQIELKKFFKRLQKYQSEVPLSYISVPEKTKKDRYHFHILAFNLLPKTSGLPQCKRGKKIPTFTTERDTRLLQNMFRKGYVDICPTTYKTNGIAGYMAKYMSKSFTQNVNNKATRNYNASRNIKKISSKGSNTIDYLVPLLTPTVNTVEVKKYIYTNKYLGKCINTRTKTIINK